MSLNTTYQIKVITELKKIAERILSSSGGSVSLPIGISTEAKQDIQITKLSSVIKTNDTDFNNDGVGFMTIRQDILIEDTAQSARSQRAKSTSKGEVYTHDENLVKKTNQLVVDISNPIFGVFNGFPYTNSEVDISFTNGGNITGGALNPVITNVQDLVSYLNSLSEELNYAVKSTTEIIITSGTADVTTINYISLNFLVYNHNSTTTYDLSLVDLVDEELNLLKNNLVTTVTRRGRKFTPTMPLTGIDEIEIVTGTQDFLTNPNPILSANTVEELAVLLNKNIPEFQFITDGLDVVVLDKQISVWSIVDLLLTNNEGYNVVLSNTVVDVDTRIVNANDTELIEVDGTWNAVDITATNLYDLVALSGNKKVLEVTALVVEGVATIFLDNGLSLIYTANTTTDRVEGLKNNRGIKRFQVIPGITSRVRILYKLSV